MLRMKCAKYTKYLRMPKRFKKMQYTLRHRKAFRQVEKELTGRVSLSGWMHDLDKVILYLIFGVKITSKIHHAIAGHHVPNCLSSNKNKIQAIIDWECARITKPDKPLNAHDTLLKYYSEYTDQFMPLIKDLIQ